MPDAVKLPGIQPWIKTPISFPDVQKMVVNNGIFALLSEDDQYVPDYKGNSKQWIESLAAEVLLETTGKHFNEKEEPAIRNQLFNMIAMGQ